MLRNIATNILSLAGRLRRRFVTVHTRPIFVVDMPHRGGDNEVDEECAVVIQGPIKRENNFTFETVKLYRRHYPSATIILSTWEDEDVTMFEQYSGEKFKILRSTPPAYRGACNVNMQIVSTRAGVDFAHRSGFSYVLKTRTDQRMYGINSLEFLKNMLDCFPLSNTTQQKNRIIATNTGTSKIRLYHFSDLFMFGNTMDMKTYWNPPLEMDKTINPRDFLAEGYLFTHFLKNTGWRTENTREDFMKALGGRCLVVDNESVDVYWPKYASIWREYRLRNYTTPTTEITFKSWLNEMYIPFIHKEQKSDK